VGTQVKMVDKERMRLLKLLLRGYRENVEFWHTVKIIDIKAYGHAVKYIGCLRKELKNLRKQFLNR